MGYVNFMNVFIFIVIGFLLTGCSSNNLNRDIYNALQQRECIQKTGEPNCDSGQPDYAEYHRERDEIVNQK